MNETNELMQAMIPIAGMIVTQLLAPPILLALRDKVQGLETWINSVLTVAATMLLWWLTSPDKSPQVGVVWLGAALLTVAQTRNAYQTGKERQRRDAAAGKVHNGLQGLN